MSGMGSHGPCFWQAPAGKRTIDRWTGHDVHHAVEKWIQEDYLNLTGGYDDCPGWVLNTKDHTFGKERNKEGTLYGDLETAVKAIRLDDPDRELKTAQAIKGVYLKAGSK